MEGGASSSDRNKSGQRRSKRPDIKLYVPKGRIQEHEFPLDEDIWEGDAGISKTDSLADKVSSPGSNEPPRKVDLDASFGALQVTVVDDHSSEPSIQQQEDNAINDIQARKDEYSYRQELKYQDSSPAVANSKERGGRKRQEDQDKKKGKEDIYMNKNICEQPVNRRDSQQKYKGSSQRWEEKNGGVRSSDREERSSGRGKYFHNDGRNGTDDGSDADAYAHVQGEHRSGMGRGRQRHPNYHRSSSNESLTKSVDMGQRSARWPVDSSPPQHSGTFPRAKSGKNRGRGAGTDNKQPVGRGRGAKHTFSTMQRQRERSGSFSSDTSGGSDMSWEDLEAEMEEAAANKPDWNTQVEQHLEQVARQVQDSTQRLTDNIESCFDPFAINSNAEWQGKPQKNAQSGLNRNLSSSSDHIFSQEYRGRKKESHHKGPRSKNSSRESSIHSNPCDNDPWPTEEKKPRKRHRRRHSSAGPGGRVGTVEGQRAAESLRILVGKNKEKRQVVLDGKPGSKGGTADIHAPNVGNGQHRRQRQHSSSEQHKKGAEHFHPHREKHRDYGSGDKSGINQIAERRKSDHHGSVHSIGDSDRKTQGPRTHQDSRDDYAHTQSHQSHHQDTKLQINNNQQTQGTLSRFSSASANSLENASSHHGGLIKLPPESQANKSHQTHNHGYNHGYNQSHSYGKGFGQGQEYGEDSFRRGFSQGHTSFQGQNGSQVYNSGSGHGERHLFDPKNPSKPIMVPDPRPLKFVDPEETHSPQDSFTPPPHVHSPGPVVSPGMGPAFPSFLPPHPSFMYPPHMPMPYPGFPCAPPPGHPVPHPMFYGFQPHPRLSMENGAYQDESYYNREVEQMMPGMSRPQCRMMAEQILRDSAPLDCQLGNILSRGQLGEDGERRVKQLRQELQRRYEKIILLDIDVASQRGVEQQLWRSVYYNIIEGLRRQSSDASGNDSTAKQTLLEILDEGTSFYESLLNKLQSTYSISLESLLEEGSATEGSGRGCRLAILSAQRTMMFLGDIARYREQASHTANYGKARHWYMRAQKLAPKNGRPYNQLAILAVYTRRKLDAVYYYQRSLAASNPILTARESLMSLFDEVRRKEEAVEQKRLEEARQRRRRRGALPQSRPRVEVWIAPDGSSSRDPFDNISSDDDDLSSLSAIELNKRFVLTFLNVHGKLFTKINFEVFVESASLMLQEWRLLLQHSPTVISSMRMLQIMAINMFSIDSTALKDESLEASCRSLLQEHAVEVGLDMFGILVARVTELFEFHLNSPQSPQQLMSDDLRQLLPGVKLWVDWMMCHSCLWNPQPSLRPPDIGPVVNVWQNVAQLCNMLKRVNTSQVHHFPDRCEGCEPLVLMEDTMMAGFVPLLSAPVDTVYVKAGEDKEIAQDCMRLEKIVLFGEYLCGIEPPMLSFDVENGRYYSVAPAPVRSEEKLAGSDLEQGAKTADVIIESEESGEDGDEMPGEAIQKLKARKAELSRRVEAQARDKHTLQTLVEEGRPAKLEMEVRPRFLVTDTNCLIDHLPALRSMLSAGTFTVVVPLVVLNELDGLAKGNRNVTGRGGHSSDESPEHASMVMRHASHALDFLESEFKSKNSHLRVQTSKGSILDSLAFRSEESDSSGNNDDLILSCCLHYCKDMARDFMPRDKDSPVRLFRDVVLLTDDRNLRLKAHTSNVPVKDVPAFCRWSKVT